MENFIVESAHSSSGDSTLRARICPSRLAPDILLEIFFVLRELYANKRDRLALWKWLPVTKVCRHWRIVALECAGLWSDIRSTRYLDEMGMFLERSDVAELKLDLQIFTGECSGASGEEVVTLFAPHVWRTRSLKVVMSDKRPWSLSTLLLAMKGRMKTLELRERRKRTVSVPDYSSLIIGLPDDMLEVQLESLALDSVFFPWSSSLYRGLMELEISDSSGTAIRPTLFDFVRILEQCPKLRKLRLDKFWPSFEGIKGHDLDNYRVNLPFLDDLEFCATPFHIQADLFTILPIKDDEYLDIRYVREISESPIRMLSKVLEKRKACNTMDIELCASKFCVASKALLDNGTPWTNFKISLECDRTAVNCAMDSFCTLVADPWWQTADTAIFSFVDETSAGTLGILKGETWASLLDNIFSPLKHLIIKYSAAFTDDQVRRSCIQLLEDLSSLVENAGTSIEADFRLPGLEDLTFHHVESEETRRMLREILNKRSCESRQSCKLHFASSTAAHMETQVLFKNPK